MIILSCSSTHINRSRHWLGKDLLFYLKWAEYLYMQASSHWLKWGSPSRGFYTSGIAFTFRCYLLYAYFPIAYKTKTKPQANKRAFRWTYSCLHVTRQWKIPMRPLWIWLCHYTLNFCKAHIAHSLAPCSLSTPHFLSMQHFIFAVQEIRQ